MSQIIATKPRKSNQAPSAQQAYSLPQIRRDRVFTSSAASGQVRVKRVHPAKLAQRQRDYKRANHLEAAEAQSANVPGDTSTYAITKRHYDPEDRIALAQPERRPVSMREAIPGINCPGEGDTWDDIHAFRAKWKLPPVKGE